MKRPAALAGNSSGGPAGILALVLLFVAPSARLEAQPPLVLNDTRDHYRLGQHLAILEDESGYWTLDDVTSPALTSAFRPADQEAPNFGFTDSAYWVRFRIENRSSIQTWRWVLSYAGMNHVTLYRPARVGQGFEAVETGNALPFATREIPHRQFLFELPSLANDSSGPQQYYARFETQTSMKLPLEIWSARGLERRQQHSMLGLGLFYGVMLALIGYNLLLFFSLREAIYLYHVLHIGLAMLCLFSFDGLAQQYLWPHDLPWDSRTVLFFLCSSTAAVSIFTSQLLQTRTIAPMAHRVLKWLVGLCLSVCAASVVLPYAVLAKPAILLQLLAYLHILITGLIVTRRGLRPMRFFLVAWLVFVVSIPIVLVLTTIFPLLPNEWLNFCVRFGTDGYVLFFSLALADRIHLTRREKEQAQAELVREQQDALKVKDVMNQALQASKSELEARNAELERYAYTVSHDLQSPIVTIKGFLGWLEKDLDAGQVEKCRTHVQRVYGAADKMSRLLDELLEMSRVGRVIGATGPVDLTEVAQEAADLVVGADEDRELHLTIEASMPVVIGDRTRLVEVLQNLIENALKFARHRASIRIDIRAWQEGDQVTCAIRDNGIGIDPKYHETVFGLFDQLDPKGGGTGIGLALVKRIIEVHGGKIWVESEGAGHGSTFQFTLPLYNS